MSLKDLGTVGAVSLWWHLAVLIICYALVYSSLGNEAAKPDTKAWDGLSYDDPQVNIKIFSYVFSIYLGVEMSGIRPRNGFAYIVRNLILFCRMLFVLHVAKNIFFMIAETIASNNEHNVKDAVHRFLAMEMNKYKNGPLDPQVNTRNLDSVV